MKLFPRVLATRLEPSAFISTHPTVWLDVEERLRRAHTLQVYNGFNQLAPDYLRLM